MLECKPIKLCDDQMTVLKCTLGILGYPSYAPTQV